MTWSFLGISMAGVDGGVLYRLCRAGRLAAFVRTHTGPRLRHVGWARRPAEPRPPCRGRPRCVGLRPVGPNPTYGAAFVRTHTGPRLRHVDQLSRGHPAAGDLECVGLRPVGPNPTYGAGAERHRSRAPPSS
ncbi:MAG: hypothetical protein MZV70_63535 [Desulfobacterales bacterium]|nr:hypothetical protein [Desulfobacterales bacterium]